MQLGTKIFVSRQCELCQRITVILKKKELEFLRPRVETIDLDQDPHGAALFASKGGRAVPLLVDSNLQLEGPAVWDWLTAEVTKAQLDVTAAMNPHHSQYRAGNKRFIFAMIIVFLALRLQCDR